MALGFYTCRDTVLSEKITWPAYEDLPEALKVDRHPVRFHDGTFVSADGKRAFLIGVYTKDDPRFDLYGRRDLKNLPPSYDLYDPDLHAWIYERPLDATSAARLGFNLCCITLTPSPFYEQLGYRAPVPQDPDYVERLARAIKIPFYVDFVAWPWGLGAPGQPAANLLPPESLNPGRGHWMPYRTIGDGRKVWLSMWRLYARRLRDAGVPVMIYELFNEPGYAPVTDDHRTEFLQWLKKRYGSLQALNQTWGSFWQTWERICQDLSPTTNPAVWLDYDEYLAETFTDLFLAGKEAIREIDPDAVCVVQPMRRAALVPIDAVHYEKLLDFEEIVVSPTDGGIWTPGRINQNPNRNWVERTLAPAPISSDLLLRLAGEKMLFDNEMYLTGKTRRSTRNELWTRVLLGYDGVTLFEWSKRGWSWWDGKKRLREEAERHPYAALIPLARTTAALRGILDFAQEIEKVREFVLPKPWGPKENIAFLWSWADARRKACERILPEKTMEYYAAVRYTHWPVALLPTRYATTDKLSEFRVVMLAGVTYLEKETAQNLENYVRNGGLLLVAEQTASLTPYGQPNGFSQILGLKVSEYDRRPSRVARPAGVSAKGMPAELVVQQGVQRIRHLGEADPLILDKLDRPVAVVNKVGKGAIWYIAVELHEYSLAGLLEWLLELAGEEKPICILDTHRNQYATNVLASLREYDRHIALLLLNQDNYPKHLRITFNVPAGRWTVHDPLEEYWVLPDANREGWSAEELKQRGVSITIEAGDFRLLILRHE